MKTHVSLMILAATLLMSGFANASVLTAGGIGLLGTDKGTATNQDKTSCEVRIYRMNRAGMMNFEFHVGSADGYGFIVDPLTVDKISGTANGSVIISGSLERAGDVQLSAQVVSGNIVSYTYSGLSQKNGAKYAVDCVDLHSVANE